jgi:hypothetical protein
MNPKAFQSCLILLLVPFLLTGQSSIQKRAGSFKDNWSVNLNAGMTSYYGDLSLYDNNFSLKLKHESLPAIGVLGNKQLKHGFSLSGQFLYGRLKGQKKNLKMSSQLIEYNAHLRLNLAELFTGRSNPKVGLTVFGGIGNFIFHTTLIELLEGGTIEESFRTRVPEFVYFAGGGGSFSINSKIGITTELSVRKFQNDKMDGVVADHAHDYYTYLSFGITHKINTVQPRNGISRKKGIHPSLTHSPVYRPNLDYNQSLKR